ncbi:hypothetical protein [Okeania sp. SIO1I7]|nr:hypothetical protein [Okeania sp. SIO1I7]NET26618.1 hypothetical protein [Okeania sp. SIO1I7]
MSGSISKVRKKEEGRRKRQEGLKARKKLSFPVYIHALVYTNLRQRT